MKSILIKLVLVNFLFTSFNAVSQVVTEGIMGRGGDNQNFRSIAALSNGDIVACFATGLDYISIKLPPGHGAYEDDAGSNAVICFTNDLTEVNWAVTSTDNPVFDIDQLQTDDYGNTYAVFTGNMSDPFILNDSILSEAVGPAVVLVKIDVEGGIVWHRIFEGTSLYFDDKLKLENGEIHMLIPFHGDITHPVSGETLPIIGDRDYYLTRLSLDNEPLGCLHLYTDEGNVAVYNYAIASNGNYSFALRAQKNFGINGVTHYETPDLGYHYTIYEVSEDGETLRNTIRFYSTELDLVYNSNNRLIIAGKSDEMPFDDFPADTVIIANPRIFFSELSEDFEPEWIQYFYTPSGTATSDLRFNDLKVDCLGNYYLTGSAQHNTAFGDFIFEESSLSANDWGDAFIVKTDFEGEPEWLKYGGGELFTDEGEDIAIDDEGNVFVAGYYMTDCFFDDIDLESVGGGSHTEGMILRISNTDAPTNYPSIATSEITDEYFGGDASINITVTDGIPAYSFDWNNDELNDFDDPEDLLGLVAGTYSVVVKDSNSCKYSETFVIESFVNVENENNTDAFTIYPNPFDDYTTISFDHTLANNASIVIKNMIGQEVCTRLNISGNSLIIFKNELGRGVYFLSVYNSEQVLYTTKIIVN